FDAGRLQGDLVVAAADEHVGAEAEAGGGRGGGADIFAGQGALLHLARREDGPNHVGAVGEAEIDAELLDLALVAFAGAVGLREHAGDALGRAEDEAGAAGHPAIQWPDIDAGAGGGRRGEKRRQADGSDETLEHGSPLELLRWPKSPREFWSV